MALIDSVVVPVRKESAVDLPAFYAQAPVVETFDPLADRAWSSVERSRVAA